MLKHVKIPNTSGKELAAVIHSPLGEDGKLAVLCPGYLDSKDYDHLTYLGEELVGHGYIVVRFDPMGTWESEGKIGDYTISQYLQDIKTVLDYMSRHKTYDSVLLAGHSLGGMVSILCAIGEPRISAVVAIMAPYASERPGKEEMLGRWKKEGFRTSRRDQSGQGGAKEFKVPYSFVEDSQKYNVLNEVHQLRISLLLVAGELDEVVPTEDIKLIWEKANEPKRLLELKGIGHDYRHSFDEIKKVNNKILDSLGD